MDKNEFDIDFDFEKEFGLTPEDLMDPELDALAQNLLSWNSILDCHVKRGEYGLELEIVCFQGEKLPQLPTAARLVIRPWDPSTDRPLLHMSSLKIPEMM